MEELELSRRPTHQVLKGIGVALIASYLYVCLALLVAMFTDLVANFVKRSPFLAKDWAELLLWLPFGAVTATPWFVAPVGIILGIKLPSRAHSLAPKNAAMRGFTWGALLGCLGGVLIAVAFSLSSGGGLRWSFFGPRLKAIALLVTTMGAYSAVWVSSFAYVYARKAQREPEGTG
jgi:hypothetical protein